MSQPSDRGAIDDAAARAARVEIERLHAFFVRWFAGATPRDHAIFTDAVTRRFAPEFWLVQPAGDSYDGGAIAEAIFSAHGTNPDFRIAIRGLEVRLVAGDLTLVTYEEWQRNAARSSPPDNGRLASALLRSRGGELEWVHIHETWLPADVMAAGPFDF